MKEYKAIVTNENDPEGYKRTQVRVFELFPEKLVSEKDLPWATYKMPLLAGFNEGCFVSAKKGNIVWVDFPETDKNGKEDTTQPRITGWVHWCPDGLPGIPHEAFNGPASLEEMHERPEDVDIELPEENQSADAFSISGIVFEFLRNSVLRITQKTSGTAIEISKSGNGGFFSQNNLFLTATKKLKLIASEIVIDGKEAFSLITSALDLTLKSLMIKVSGKLLIKGMGGTKITGADLSLIATQGSMNLDTAGMLNQNSTGANIEKITVDTQLSADSAKLIEVQAGGVVLGSIMIAVNGNMTLMVGTTTLSITTAGVQII